MFYWQYRAFDCNTMIHVGVATSEGNDINAFARLSAELRQRGLQVVELITIPQEVYSREVKLAKWKAVLNPPSPLPTPEPPQTKSIRSRISAFIAALFVRRNA